jgi:probable HAF family extracellular repeat protein
MNTWNARNWISPQQTVRFGSAQPSARRPSIRRLCLEALEDRCLLSSYTLTDLGTLGGPYSSAAGINSGGEVVGSADTNKFVITNGHPGIVGKFKDYQQDPFLWKPSAPNGAKGSMTDLGSLSGLVFDNNGASGINGPGQVVGQTDVNTLGTLVGRAFLWTPSTPNGTSGAMIDLGTLGGIDSRAGGINLSGRVVGTARTSSGAYHAFLWTPTTPNGMSGTMADLGTLGGANSYAAGINDSGEVAGSSDGGSIAVASAAFLYSGGKMIDLGSLGASGVQNDSQAIAINNFGQVVGASYTGTTDAFLWTPSTPNGTSGTMIDLGSLGGNTVACGINTAGQVVGSSYTSSGLQHPFLWTPTTPNGNTGTMIDLNTLTGSSTVSLEGALGINDRGQIVGFGTLKSGGSDHAFLLSPTSTTTALAQRPSSTPMTSPAGPTVAPGGDPSLVPILASPPSDGASFGPTTVSAVLPVPQPPATAAGATSPAVPFSPTPLFVPPLTSNLPPAGRADSFQPIWASEAAADRVFANLDAELSLALFVDDLVVPPRN